MRKLQITSIYFMFLLMLFFIPKPKSLLEMETYESKLRKIEQIQDEKSELIVNFSQIRDTFSYRHPTP